MKHLNGRTVKFLRYLLLQAWSLISLSPPSKPAKRRTPKCTGKCRHDPLSHSLRLALVAACSVKTCNPKLSRMIKKEHKRPTSKHQPSCRNVAHSSHPGACREMWQQRRQKQNIAQRQTLRLHFISFHFTPDRRSAGPLRAQANEKSFYQENYSKLSLRVHNFSQGRVACMESYSVDSFLVNLHSGNIYKIGASLGKL